MNQNDKDALAAAMLIKAYCNSIDGTGNNLCLGCIFADLEMDPMFGLSCVLSNPNHLPETWQLDKAVKK